MRNLFYGALRIEGSDVPLETQQRVLELGVRTRDYDMLAALAAVPSLDGSIDDALREVNAAAVRKVWISRPGRSPETILGVMAGEKRVGALVAIGSTDGLPVSVYETLAGHDKLKVVAAVAENETVPMRVRVDAVRNLTRLMNAGGANSVEEAAYSRLLDSHADLLNAAVDTVIDMCVEKGPRSSWFPSGYSSRSLLRSSGLAETVQRRLVDEVLLPRSSSRSAAGIGALLSICGSLAENQALSFSLIESVRVVVRRIDVDNITVWKTSDRSLERGNLETVIARHLKALDELEKGSKYALEAARTTDPVRMEALLKAAPRPEVGRVALAICRNEHAPDALIAATAPKMTDSALREYIQDRSDNDELVASILVKCSYLLTRELLDSYPDPSELLRAYARRASTAAAVSRLAQVGGVPLDVLFGLPPANLEYLCSISPPIATRVVEHLNELLGNNAEQWDILESMWQTADTSTTELLSMVNLVAAT